MPTVDLAAKILRYPLDLTGTSLDNYVEAEVRELPVKLNRAVVLSNGPFYTESVVVHDNMTGELLDKRTQYVAAQLVEAATTRSGKEVCSVIIVTDPSVSNQIRVDYQAVGGPYILSIDALISMVDALSIDDRPIIWGEIIGKPDLFPSGHHLHDAGDVFGFEYLVLAVEEVRKAILMGDIASHDEIYAYITDVDNRLVASINDVSDALETHATSINNPHNTTKDQIGLNNIENYGIATKLEAEDGIVSNKYMTPQRVKQAIDKQAGTLLQAHIDNKANPHNTTKAQVGLSNVEDYRIANQTEAEAGVVNNVYMTPTLVKQAITYQAITPLTNLINTHASRTNNPHSVTKSQVGLGSVEDFGIASQAEAEAGVVTNKYMTPQRVKQAIQVIALNPIALQITALNNHASNINNPHSTTKTQVGLGSVNNYPVATQAEAEAGAANYAYATPLSMMWFRNAYQTVSTVAPTVTAGYKNGHIWYKV